MVKWSHLEYERNSQKKWLQLHSRKWPGSLFYVCGAIATETHELEEKRTGNEKRRGQKGGFCQRFMHFHSSIHAETHHRRARVDIKMMEVKTDLLAFRRYHVDLSDFKKPQILLGICWLHAVANLYNLQPFHRVRKCTSKRSAECILCTLVTQPSCQCL